MTKRVSEAKAILSSLGLPKAQQNERSCLTLLALAGIGPKGKWQDAGTSMLRTVDIMAFMKARYKKVYAANSRETIRRQTLHQFEQARVVDRNPDDPTRATNSGKTVYRITDDALAVISKFGTREFDSEVAGFIEKFGSLQTAYLKDRKSHQVTLKLPNGETLFLSPGAHNKLQVKVIEAFGPRFAPGAEVLYVGDTAKKHVRVDGKRLSELGVSITEHDKLPDIVLYLVERNWLFLIEAVTSHGPVSPKRHRELESSLTVCKADRVYVTAFPDVTAFRKYAGDIAWETEVWMADQPDHLIHFNGPKFLGPYKPTQDT